MKTITMLIGLPASGKSTWRSYHKMVEEQLGHDTVYVSSDDLIDAIAMTRGKTYSEVFKEVVGECDSLAYLNFKNAIAAGKNVVIDRTNMSKKSRRRYLAQVPADYHREAVVFEVSEEELSRRLTERAEKTGKFIPPGVVSTMRASYEVPTEEEFDTISFVKQSSAP